MRCRSAVRVLVCAFVASSVLVVPTGATAATAATAPGLGRSVYIVRVANASQRGPAMTVARGLGGVVHHEYSAVFAGFAVELPDAAAAALARNHRIVSIEPDAIATTATTQSPAPSWGLDRIDQRLQVPSLSYTYATTGAGVKAYVVDSGVRGTHVDFGGRVVNGFDAITTGANGWGDCNGHGTHVAGTIGGTTYGVAKNVTIVPVRVLGCNGSGAYSGVIAGIDWAVANHTSGPAVMNLSLTGPVSSAVDDAIARAVADGITVAVAAGNNTGASACDYSPARAPAALTVGATTALDARAPFSNLGSCVDLFAPGDLITSDWNSSNSATNILSGTSMATPHVAGAAARYLQANPTATPNAVGNALKTSATSGSVLLAGTGSPNLLLWADPNAAPSPTTTTTTTRPPTTTTTTTRPPTTTTTTTRPPTTTTTTRPPTTTTTTTTRPPSSISMTASPTVASDGSNTVTLRWSGATGTDVDVYRNATKFSTRNDGFYRETVAKGTYTYKVCLTGSSTCSSPATVTFS